MKQKELVILAVQLDLVACRWSIASIDAAGSVDPLIQSTAGDLNRHATGSLDERTSFLRHRIAGALQRGADRLWGLARKAESFAIEFTPAQRNNDSELISRVAEHFCTWMVKPPVVCLQTEPDGPPSVLAANLEAPDLPRISLGLETMRPLATQADLWETAPEAPEH